MITIELGTNNYLHTVNQVQKELRQKSNMNKKLPIILIIKKKVIYTLKEYKQIIKKITQSAFAIALIVEDFFQNLVTTFVKNEFDDTLRTKRFTNKNDAENWLTSFY